MTTTYNMYTMIQDIVGTPSDSIQSFLLYMAAIVVSLIFVFFVIYMFKFMAGLITSTYR